MKLNLLPTTVSQERKARTAIIAAAVIGLAGIVLGVGLALWSRQEMVNAKAAADALRPTAQEAYQTSIQADELMTQVTNVVRNINLSKEMIAHNDRYPDFYNKIRPYIPGYYRITSMVAEPIDAENVQVTLTGYLSTEREYADLTLALLAIPDSQTVRRQGFAVDDVVVPPITPDDQVGKPRRESQPPIPDDPIQRLAYYESQASVQRFDNSGGFGTEPGTLRGARPGQSLITTVITMKGKLQAPDPRGALSGGGAAPAAAGAPGGLPIGGAPGGNVPRVGEEGDDR